MQLVHQQTEALNVLQILYFFIVYYSGHNTSGMLRDCFWHCGILWVIDASNNINKNMFHQYITFLCCFVSLARTSVIKTQVYSINRHLRKVIFACVVFYFFPLALFQSMSSLFSLVFPSNGTVVEIQTYVQSQERFCLSHSLSLGVQLRGLCCAWVPRIMITAAEKHIFTIQEIRGGNLQAEDLTSSLWLIVELTEKSPPTTNKRDTPYPLHKQEEPPLLSILLWGTSVTLEWQWNYIHKIF